MKKIFLSILALVLFTACGSSDSELTSYQGDGFTIDISNNFNFQEGFDGETRVGGEVFFNAKYKKPNATHVANLFLAKVEVAEDLKLKDFAQEEYKKITDSAKNSGYSFEESEELDKSGGMYWAEYLLTSSNGKAIKVREVFALENGVAYILTASFLANEEESIVNEIEEMLESFALE